MRTSGATYIVGLQGSGSGSESVVLPLSWLGGSIGIVGISGIIIAIEPELSAPWLNSSSSKEVASDKAGDTESALASELVYVSGVPGGTPSAMLVDSSL